MDQVTQQNAAMVEQSTAAAHALNGEATELRRLMGDFRTAPRALRRGRRGPRRPDRARVPRPPRRAGWPRRSAPTSAALRPPSTRPRTGRNSDPYFEQEPFQRVR
uniref:Methyl-accepting chemotaxis protein n=1 Tax=Phenylobacterium glaciei TaxID=2803784 RepID=A0A974P421_9CAUL|nr:methyl-accepting chemotaxis protein [Phenylobacterium glaciei]